MPLRVHYFQLTPEDVDFLVVASVSGDVIIILTTLLTDPADLERQLQHQQNAYAPAAKSHKKNTYFFWPVTKRDGTQSSGSLFPQRKKHFININTFRCILFC
jgi:hypothetical protein